MYETANKVTMSTVPEATERAVIHKNHQATAISHRIFYMYRDEIIGLISKTNNKTGLI